MIQPKIPKKLKIMIRNAWRPLIVPNIFSFNVTVWTTRSFKPAHGIFGNVNIIITYLFKKIQNIRTCFLVVTVLGMQMQFIIYASFDRTLNTLIAPARSFSEFSVIHAETHKPIKCLSETFIFQFSSKLKEKPLINDVRRAYLTQE